MDGIKGHILGSIKLYPHFSRQLSDWILPAPQVNLWIKYVILCVDSPLVCYFRRNRCSSCRCEERAKNCDYLHVSIHNTTNISSIANRRAGWDYRQNIHVSYTDKFGVPPIFNHPIGAKDMDVEEWQAGHQWIHGWPAIAKPSIDVVGAPLAPNSFFVLWSLLSFEFFVL